jgi:hypothetical protein
MLGEPLPPSLVGRPLSNIVAGIEAQNSREGLPRVWHLTNQFLLRQYQLARSRQPSLTGPSEAQSTPPIPLTANISSMPNPQNEASGNLQGRRLSHTIPDPYSNANQPLTITGEGVSGRRGSSHNIHSPNLYSHQQGPPPSPRPNLSPEGS